MTRSIASIAVVASAAFLSACASTGDGSASSDWSDEWDVRGNEGGDSSVSSAGADRPWFEPSLDGRVVGRETYDGIPRAADRVAAGYNEVRYRVPSAGRVWIGNEERRRQIVAFDVQAGDRVGVNPGRDRVFLNGQAVYSRNLERREPHAVFYESARAGGSASSFDHSRSSAHSPGPATDSSGNRAMNADATPDALSGMRRVASGRGELSYRAERRVRVAVYDTTTARLVYQGELGKGQRLSVNPARDFVRVGKAEISVPDLDDNSTYEILISPRR